MPIDLAAPLAEIVDHGENDLMQRVRIGITGLAVVFLIVLLAAAVVGFRKGKVGENANAADAANSSDNQPSDPLAELGVAPGGTPSDGTTHPTSSKP